MDNTPPPAPMYTAPAQPPKASGLGIAGMVLGIVGIVVSGCFFWLGIILGIIGVVLSAVGLKKSPQGKKGMAIAGVVCSVIAIIVAIIWWIAFANAANEAEKSLNDFNRQFNQLNSY